ncbi:conserved hypothetical protein [Ricinus communis]|uniref:Malectin-like domain-containing protein n=1 Tax=Ricinus communis TaxID=3988 RepID=B9SW64_RICCO|nr:conserved hypothetical protein [Ricinus communis]
MNVATEGSDYLNLVSNPIFRGFAYDENEPPWPLLSTAIQTKNVSDSITLPVDFSPQTSVVAYFIFYFRDPIYRYPELTGTCEISVNSQKLGVTDVPAQNTTSYVLSFYPVQINGSANVTISAVEGPKLAPLLNCTEKSFQQKFDGSIPAFLGNLSNLELIIDGNKNLHQRKEKKLALSSQPVICSEDSQLIGNRHAKHFRGTVTLAK